ncbi:MAG: hypothetical protein HY594_02915 [Candidatus Omnitrophica bacterium]|nr:hypothetical protein [Candidatus Omnitrophota bacterium]
MIETVGTFAALTLPLWNIPLILKIRRRRSSRDVSLAWAYGVMACLVGMLPIALRSPDPVFRAFAIINAALFSLVVIHVVWYR